MSQGDELKFERGTAAKTEFEDRNKNSKNRHHPNGTGKLRENLQPYSVLWNFEQGQGLLGELDRALTTYSAFEGFDQDDLFGALRDIRKNRIGAGRRAGCVNPLDRRRSPATTSLTARRPALARRGGNA